MGEPGHAAGWSVWPADRAAPFGWRWRAWGPAGASAGVAESYAEAAELAQRAERRLCASERVSAAQARP